MPGEFRGLRSLLGYSPQVAKSWTRLSDFASHFTNRGKGFPGGSVAKNPLANAGDMSSFPGLRRSPGEGNGNPLQNSSLENSMDRGARWAIAHGVAKESDVTKQQPNRGIWTSGLLSFGYLSTGHGVLRPQRISCFPVNVNVISSIRLI